MITGRRLTGYLKENKNEEDKFDKAYIYVYGSPVHLRQIFLNIYGNCIKYTQAGGMITTSVSKIEEHDNICIYRWTITDTGEGMSEEFLNHIFETFAQEKNDARSVYQGIGLGMAIVKSLLDQMGGTISVSSEKGVGSKFVITIPFEIAEMMLTDQGTKVTVAYDGKQAVDLFAESPEGKFDAILMDIMMPVMYGLTASKEIRALNRADAKEIPIIAVTANAFKEDADKCFEAGMNAHVSKPLDMQHLQSILIELCRKN